MDLPWPDLRLAVYESLDGAKVELADRLSTEDREFVYKTFPLSQDQEAQALATVLNERISE